MTPAGYPAGAELRTASYPPPALTPRAHDVAVSAWSEKGAVVLLLAGLAPGEHLAAQDAALAVVAVLAKRYRTGGHVLHAKATRVRASLPVAPEQLDDAVASARELLVAWRDAGTVPR